MSESAAESGGGSSLGGSAGSGSDSGSEPTSDSGEVVTTSGGTDGESTGAPLETCPQGISWVRVIESELPQEEVRGLAVDAAGHSVIVGEFEGDAVDFGAGPMDSELGVLYVAKYGPDGAGLWSRQFGAGMRGEDLAFDGAGNVVVTGSYWTTVDFGGGSLPVGGPAAFIVKLSPDGEHVWSRGFVGGGVSGVSVAVEASGEVALAVASQGPMDVDGVQVGGAHNNTHVLRFAADGSLVWSRAFAGQVVGASAHGVELEFDLAGAVLVGGRQDGLVDFGGEVVGTGGATVLFVARLAEDGALEWVRQSGGGGMPWLSGLRSDDAGRVHLGGGFAQDFSFGGPVLTASIENNDGFAVLLDADGQHLWSDDYGPNLLSGLGVTAMDGNGAGERLIGGQFIGEVDFGGGELVNTKTETDGFLVRQGPFGEHRWSRSFAGAGQMFISDAAIDADGAAWITGMFDGELIVGDQVFTKGVLQYQIYVMKLCAGGAP